MFHLHDSVGTCDDTSGAAFTALSVGPEDGVTYIVRKRILKLGWTRLYRPEVRLVAV